MRVSITFAILAGLFLSACATDAKRLQDQALLFATNDKVIDESEYVSLTGNISMSNDGSLKRFLTKDSQIDHPKFAQYLKTLFESKKIPVNIRDIWQPTKAEVTQKFNVNVYIENSASMDGYLTGVTEFETAIYNLLANIKISGISDALSFNYINKKVTFTKENVNSQEIEDLVTKLEPSAFRQQGGDRSITDIRDVVNLVLDKVDDKNAAILVSDFVFSPGKNINAQDYLNHQMVGLKIDFAEKLKVHDLAVAVVQLQSNFNGNYYDRIDKPHKLNCQRPYYLWVLGSREQVQAILNKNLLTDIKGGYLNRIVFNAVKGPESLDYKIQYKPKLGELPEGAKGPITKATLTKDGTFGFNIAVDFSHGLQDGKYYLDPSSYRLSNPNYKLSIEAVPDDDPVFGGFTHLMKFVTDKVTEETLTVEALNGVPSWVETSNSGDDLMVGCENDEGKRTFGLKYEIDGIAEAFYGQAKNTPSESFSISIRK